MFSLSKSIKLYNYHMCPFVCGYYTSLLNFFFILSMVKQITSPDWMHETSARAWCTGKTQRDRVEREVGGGIGMGNTCKSMADSCRCMTKTTTIFWSN